MNFTFETQGTNTYLVYQVGDEDRIDSMSLGMLTNNKIPGLASTIFTQMDMTKYVKFNVSAKISVKQFFNGPVNKKRQGRNDLRRYVRLSQQDWKVSCGALV